MNSNRHPNAMTSASPSSNEEHGSHHATPDTKLTFMSPDELRSSPRVAANCGIKVQFPPTFKLQAVSARSSPASKSPRLESSNLSDPFTASDNGNPALPRNAAATTKLSPVATNFTPLTSVYGATERFQAIDSPVTPVLTSNGDSPMKHLNRDSVPDVDAVGKPIVVKPPSPIKIIPSKDELIEEGRTRFLSISNVVKTLSATQIQLLLTCQKLILPKLVVIGDLPKHGIIYLYYEDIRDAKKVAKDLENNSVKWLVAHISMEHFVQRLSPQVPVESASFDAGVYITIEWVGNRQRYDENGIVSMTKRLLESLGDLMKFKVTSRSFPILAIQAEYFKTQPAHAAVECFNLRLVSGCSYIVTHRIDQRPMIGHERGINSLPMATMPLDGAFHRLNLNIGNIDSYPTCQDLDLTSSVPELSPASSGSQIVYTPISRDDRSPVTRAYQAYGSEGYNALPYIHNQQFMTPISRLSTEVENLTWSSPGSRNYGHGISGSTSSNRTGSSHSTISKMSPRPQSNDYASGHHNVVEIERIQLGLDVRTTIMLRNIPNKIDQAMLKEIIDETSYGKYDFMYLRIDFANNCNVGYAFINFEDPFYIIDFVKARAGNRWNRFNSDKVAEVSYATIQGKDCLVQKFRNSSVMLEHPSFRPKIYHTSSSPNVGEEDIFPSPDNPSKMRRSVENAEHVGLFAPRAGQQFRDQQRRRRSQYDRGTRLAEFEDSYEFEDRNIPAGFPHGFRSTPSPSYGHYQQNTYY